MAEKFDVFVIGSGPGGYSAAIRCAQKGASVGLVEKDAMGGTCLNRGCIPSKALLGSAHFLTLAKYAPLMGLEIGSVKPNWQKMQSRKDAIVGGFNKGVTGLMQSNGIKLFRGRGVAVDAGTVTKKLQELELISTGTSASSLNPDKISSPDPNQVSSGEGSSIDVGKPQVVVNE